MLKRLLCMLLASMMLVGTLASCGENQEGDGETVANTGDAAAETEAETREPLDIPSTRYEGKTLTFLTRDESEWSTMEIFSEGMTSDTDNINNAVYERNLKIFETYGVTIKELKKQTTSHQDAVNKEISGSNGDFQAVITNTVNSTSMASNGYLWDLNSDAIQYLDVTKPWWDQNMAEGLSINDRLFFATGDLMTADNDATFTILFNKQIAADNKLPDLYAMVKNYEWTMDQFQVFISEGARNLDGKDGLSHDADISGFAYTSDSPYALLLSGGVTLTEKNEDDTPMYSLNVDRMQGISEMGKKLFDKQYTVCLNDYATDNLNIVSSACFGENHALFMGEVMQSVTRMRQYSVDFGILPYPMYNKTQGQYYSMMHLTASMVSIPKSVVGENLDITNSMIEALAYHSDELTRQYYEINLKTKGAKDEQSAPMIDMILANRACDISYYYQWSDNAFGEMANTLLPTSTKNVSSLNASYKKNLNKEIQKVIASMEKQAAKDEAAS